jgi:GTPase SAR1 family protein
MESNANNHFNVKRVKILILGLSGAGKTSLVNLFYVWSQQWKLDDLKFKDKVLIKTKYFDGDSKAEN